MSISGRWNEGFILFYISNTVWYPRSLWLSVDIPDSPRLRPGNYLELLTCPRDAVVSHPIDKRYAGPANQISAKYSTPNNYAKFSRMFERCCGCDSPCKGTIMCPREIETTLKNVGKYMDSLETIDTISTTEQGTTHPYACLRSFMV